jgi:Fuc2NAc and GlcNAc transferase
MLLLAAVAGFLCWNFPPARIFMGDAGSGFLGLMLGLLSIQAAGVNPDFFWAWLILLGVFVVDATVTLLRRLMRRQKLYEAHRSHAYQYASRKYGAHRPVTLAAGAINLLWLMPLAMLVGLGYVDGALGLLVAYAPLVRVAFLFKAGAAEEQ